MKKFLILILASALSLLVIPVAMCKNPKGINMTNRTTAQDSFKSTQGTEEKPSLETISVFRSLQNKNETVSLHEYVCGSVAAEMPLAYEEEAIKAQAVACYTNAKRLKSTNSQKESQISDDTKIHQGYIDKKQREEKWGEDFEFYENKLQNAVSEVENEALYYEGRLCVASFFAISSGKTENAENIWGNKVPYLVSVDSSGDRLSPKCLTTVSVSKKEFIKIAKGLKLKTEGLKSLKGAIKIEEISKAGTVLKATVLGKAFTGEEIRRAFSLRSPVFTIKETADTIVFSVSGYGHGVGLSQYGADYLARQGYTYKEILLHYYKGAEVK